MSSKNKRSRPIDGHEEEDENAPSKAKRRLTAVASGEANAPPSSKPTNSLASFLSLPPPPPLPSVVATSKPIFDKDSIFISYAVPLSEPDERTIAAYISQLKHDHAKLPDVISGRTQGGKRIRPNHSMWACRTLSLISGATGTSEADYTPILRSDDDNERFSGNHLEKTLTSLGSIDVLVVCCRWFGGTLLGPIRFAHITDTAKEAIVELERREKLEGLWGEIERMDESIRDLRAELSSAAGRDDPDHSRSIAASEWGPPPPPLAPNATPSCRLTQDVPKLERLIKARGLTIRVLVEKVAELG